MKNIRPTNPILNKIMYLSGALSLLAAIFLFTNPTQVSLAALLLPFLLIGISSYVLVSVILAFFGHKTGLSAKLIPLCISFLIVTLLLLASLGQLTVKDGLLVIGFGLVFLVYVGRADFLK